jgi:hypothetical membrane protein
MQQSRGTTSVPLAVVGVFAPILFMTVVTIASMLRPGYSQIEHPISDLGNGPRSWIQNLNFTVFGLLLLCFAAAFRRGMGTVVGRKALFFTTGLLALSALGFIAAAYFPVPDAGAAESVRVKQGMLHGMSFMTIFVPLILALLVAGSRMIRNTAWRAIGWYSFVTAAISIVLIVLIMQFADPSSSLPIGGLLTRLLIVQTFAWHVVVGWHLMRGGPQQPADGRTLR